MEFNTFYSVLTFILLMTAYVRSSVVPDSDQPQTCTTSCQGFPGPAGINGIPGTGGSPGNNGSPGRDGRDGINGRDGLKGDFGSKGDKGEVGSGEQGMLGPRGPSGERGELGLRGLPGKVGPRGLVGPAGSFGLPGHVGSVGPRGPAGLPGDFGIKGDKGSTGSTRESGRLRESAFTVYKTTSQTASVSRETVTFDAARVNIGNHFDLTSNRFTCQLPGTYFFSFSVHVSAANNPDVVILMDGNTIAHARNHGVEYNQIGSSTVLEMEVGSQAWLQFTDSGEIIQGDYNGPFLSQFSGFLLYEH